MLRLIPPNGQTNENTSPNAMGSKKRGRLKLISPSNTKYNTAVSTDVNGQSSTSKESKGQKPAKPNFWTENVTKPIEALKKANISVPGFIANAAMNTPIIGGLMKGVTPNQIVTTLNLPLNAVANTLKESGIFTKKRYVNVNGKTYPTANKPQDESMADVISRVSGAFMQGLTGKESPQPIEALLPKDTVKKVEEQAPVVAAAANLGAGALMDPLTYVTGEGIGRVVSKIGSKLKTGEKIAKTAEGVTGITDVAKVPEVVKPSGISVETFKPSTPEQKTFVKNYKKTLSNNETELQTHIDDLTNELSKATDEENYMRVNLQLFAAKEKLKELQTSKLYKNTIQKSNILTAEEKAQIPEESFQYKVKSEKLTTEQAAQRVNADIEKTKDELLKKDTFNDVDTDSAMMIAKKYTEEARQTGDYSKLNEWLASIRPKATATGRGIQAFAKWSDTPEGFIKNQVDTINNVERAIKKTNPDKLKKVEEGVNKVKEILNNKELTPDRMFEEIKKIVNPGKNKMTMDKLMEIVNKSKNDEKIDFDAIRNILKEKNGIPTLSDADLSYMDEMYRKAKEYDPESYEYRMYMEKARKIVEDKMPTEFVDKFRALQRLSMIFNLKTLVTRNPGGNVLLMSLTQLKENTLGAFVDMITSAIRGSERTTLAMPLSKAKAMGKGAKKGLREWRQDIVNNVDTNPTHGQLELQKGKVFKGDNPVSRVLNQMDIIEKRLLQLGDRPFYEAAKEARLTELKWIKKTDTATDEMLIDAKAYALDKVFQRDSELSKIFGNMKNASQKTWFKTLANVILPFSQTPANVLDKMIEFSPGGFVKAFRELAFPKNGVFNQKYFVDTLSSGITGTGLLVLGYMAAKNGVIGIKVTGKPDTSEKVRNFKSATGQGNYALKFGDTYYTIDWAQPVATMLLAGAEAFNGGMKKADFAKAIQGAAEAGGNTFFNMSMLKNVAQLFGVGNNPTGGFINAIMGSSTQFTPTFGKQIAQIIDPYVRETYDPNKVKEQYNIILSRLPWLSKTLPKKQNVFGQDIKAYQGRNSFLNVMLNPGFLTKETMTPEQKEMQRLYESQGDTEVLPSVVGKTITFNGKDIKLTPDEYVKYQKLAGQYVMTDFKVDSKAYTRLKTDEQKASYVASIMRNALAKAKNDMLIEKGVIKKAQR
ncbi:MAG: hypothetical protein ACM3TR_09780 [Caulobacteraceae bacterium]